MNQSIKFYYLYIYIYIYICVCVCVYVFTDLMLCHCFTQCRSGRGQGSVLENFVEKHQDFGAGNPVICGNFAAKLKR